MAGLAFAPAAAIAGAMRSLPALAAFALLSACNPPASDDYAARVQVQGERRFASAPLSSPEVEGALWAVSPRTADRLLYGQPGKPPLMGLTCNAGRLVITRYAPADAEAKAVMALIGNGHVERLFVDAVPSGGGWVWQGAFPATDTRLEVLTGRNRVEVTIPGAGTLVLNPGSLAGPFIARCAVLSPPAPVRPAGPA